MANVKGPRGGADKATDRPVSASEGLDGRLLRSARSRRQIVDAMLALIRAGEMSPGAAQVAERAQVGLRTVFRHFEDMDSLYREMSAQIEAEIQPILQEPYAAPDWRGRLSELIARRARLYDHVMPVKVAASLRRFESTWLMTDYERFLLFERSALTAILPRAIVTDAVLFSAIEMATSFQAWRRMRQDQGLGTDVAEDVMRHVVDRLIAGR